MESRKCLKELPKLQFYNENEIISGIYRIPFLNEKKYGFFNSKQVK